MVISIRIYLFKFHVTRLDIKNIFFPDSIKIWKNLGSNFHSCTSLSNFKNQIISLIRPNHKQTFNIHDCQGLKYIFQLRVGLIVLRSHKKIHHFNDTSSEWCECNFAPEDTDHYLLHCNSFQVSRI